MSAWLAEAESGCAFTSAIARRERVNRAAFSRAFADRTAYPVNGTAKPGKSDATEADDFDVAPIVRGADPAFAPSPPYSVSVAVAANGAGFTI